MSRLMENCLPPAERAGALDMSSVATPAALGERSSGQKSALLSMRKPQREFRGRRRTAIPAVPMTIERGCRRNNASNCRGRTMSARPAIADERKFDRSHNPREFGIPGVLALSEIFTGLLFDITSKNFLMRYWSRRFMLALLPRPVRLRRIIPLRNRPPIAV